MTIGLDDKILRGGSVWGCLILRELICENQLSFQTRMRYSEDALFRFDLLRTANPERICHLELEGYCYRQNSSSAVHQSKEAMAPRYYDSMRQYIRELKDRIQTGIPNPAVDREMRNRQKVAVCNAMYMSIFLTEKTPMQILREMKAAGLYPCGINWRYLRFSTPKETVMNYFRMLLPLSWFYLAACTGIRVSMNLRSKIRG